MESNLLDRMLDTYLSGQMPVTMTLQNKIRVIGKIKAFDSYVIVMEGQKWELVYRHAVSSISPNTVTEQTRRPMAPKSLSPRTAPSNPAKTAPRKPKTALPQAPSAAGEEQGISNTMKDGLLRWMQEQRAAE